MKKNIIIGLSAIIVLLIGFFIHKDLIFKAKATATSGVCGKGGCEVAIDKYKGVEVGNQIPDLELVDKDGKISHLYDLLQGKEKFILTMSVDWCSDCKRQNEKLNNYYDKLPKNYGAAAVYVDFDSSSGDPRKQTDEIKTIKFLKEKNYKFPNFYDKNNKIKNTLKNITSTPRNYVLNEEGIIKAITEEIDMDILFNENQDKEQSSEF